MAKRFLRRERATMLDASGATQHGATQHEATKGQCEAIAGLRQDLASYEPISPRLSSFRQNDQADSGNTAGRARRRTPDNRRRPPLSLWIGMPLLVLGSMITGGAGLIALQWLMQPPPIPNCRALSPLAAPAKRLHCAQQLAATGTSAHLIASINTVASWGPDHPLYQEAQTLLTDWSTALLNNAEVALDRSGLEQARRLVRYIPKNSDVYEAAQGKLSAWQQQWDDGNRIHKVAMDAIATQDWKQASQQVIELGELPSSYWHQTRANILSLRIASEQQGRQILSEAQAMATDGGHDQLATALIHLQTIPPQTLAQQAADPLQQQWGRTVLKAAMAQWDAGQLERAVVLAQALPPSLPSQISSSARALDLIRYSHAQRLAAEVAEDSDRWWLLPEAIAAAERLSPQSELAQQIEPQLDQWRSQLSGMAQLQVAQAMAATGQRWLLEASIAQADSISPDGPQRFRAETLIADWRRSIAQIDGRPYFSLAQRVAQPGTAEALSAAIRIAEPLVASGLEWPQVQQALADWRSQIQTIEDRPILAKAQQYAAEGDLWKAIGEAETIAAGRALHGEAQGLVQNWQGTLQAQKDRNRLAEARDLAAQLQLSRAIEVAQAIAPNSGDVYNEAQSAIAQWQQERDEIWLSRQHSSPQFEAPQYDASEASSDADSDAAAQDAAPEPAPSDAGADSYTSPYYGYYGTGE